MAAAAPFIAMGASAAMSSAGSAGQGNASAAAYKFDSSVQRQQESQALDQSYVQAREIEDQNARRSGAAAAAYGSSGVVANTGTPLHVMNDIVTEGEMSRQLALYQGKVNAFGHRQAYDVDIANAHAARRAMWITVADPLLGMLAKGAVMQYWSGSSAGGSAAEGKAPLSVNGSGG